MKKIVCGLFLIVLTSSAYAVKVKSIYEAEVAVQSQDESFREPALRQAFAQALTKVSGSSTVLENPNIRKALSQAKNNVQEFSYQPSGLVDQPYLLKVRFEPATLKKIIREAKAPLWDEDRPLILVLIAIDDGKHPAELLDASSAHPFLSLLKQSAYQRGLPLLLPLMDMNDLSQISLLEVQELNAAALQKTVDRYHCDGLLVGTISPKAQGYQSHWRLLLGKEQADWVVEAEAPQPLMSTLFNKMTSILSGRYAAVLTDSSPSDFSLTVKGVSEHDDFENLLRFLKHISLIKDLQIENIEGDAVVFHLAVQGSQQAFKQDASVGQHLQLESEGSNQITYLWVR